MAQPPDDLLLRKAGVGALRQRKRIVEANDRVELLRQALKVGGRPAARRQRSLIKRQVDAGIVHAVRVQYKCSFFGSSRLAAHSITGEAARCATGARTGAAL